MKKGRMQCKDVPDRPILEFLLAAGGEWRFSYSLNGSEYDARSVLTVMPPGTPRPLAVAKMGTLIRRGLVSGCACGCRGDFVITESGERYLKSRRALDRAPS